MKKVRVIFWALVVLFVVIQFFGPERTNPPVDPQNTVQANTAIPADILAILKRSCYDCHSNETQWPWYSYIAPVSWLVIDDVNHGRSHVNFSDWRQYDPEKIEKVLDEICEEVEDGNMPIGKYVLMHPKAKLSPEDVEAICAWTKAELTRLKSEGTHTDDREQQ